MPPPNFALDAAIAVSTLSPCRSKRGVVIFDRERIRGSGYNDQVAPFECEGTAACKTTCRETAVHAEQFALLQAGKAAAGCDLVHVKTVDGQLVAVPGPSCVQCSKLMIPAGITGVWLFLEEGWRRFETDKFHRLSVVARYPDQPGGTNRNPANESRRT